MGFQHARLPAAEHLGVVGVSLGHAGTDEREHQGAGADHAGRLTQVDLQDLRQAQHRPVGKYITGHRDAGFNGLHGRYVQQLQRLLVIHRLTGPQVGPGEESINFGVDDPAGFAQVVHKGAAHPSASLGATFAFLFRQRPTVAVSLFGEPGIAHDDVGAFTTHLLDDVTARGPQIRQAGNVSLQGKCRRTFPPHRIHQVEGILVTAVKMNAHGFSTVGRRCQGQCLADTAVLAGPGDQDPLATERPGVVFAKGEARVICRECHGGTSLNNWQ